MLIATNDLCRHARTSARVVRSDGSNRLAWALQACSCRNDRALDEHKAVLLG